MAAASGTAAELRVLSAGAMREIVLELGEVYRRDTGIKVVTSPQDHTPTTGRSRAPHLPVMAARWAGNAHRPTPDDADSSMSA